MLFFFSSSSSSKTCNIFPEYFTESRFTDKKGVHSKPENNRNRNKIFLKNRRRKTTGELLTSPPHENTMQTKKKTKQKTIYVKEHNAVNGHAENLSAIIHQLGADTILSS